MADKSKIAWTEATWNFLRGCSVVSAGCTLCYAMREAGGPRLGRPGGPYEGLTKPTKAGPVWTGEIRVVEHLIDQPLRWRRPRLIFVASMSDPFHPGVSDATVDRAFDVMEAADHHVYQLLTKRPERMADYVQARYWRRGQAGAPRHIWLGTSIEDQRATDERLPPLLRTPAELRFLSCEPLIGPLTLEPWLTVSGAGSPALIDWVIVGGESGEARRRRDMNLDWARRLRDECARAGVPFFYKQGSGAKPGMNPTLDGVQHHAFPFLPGERRAAS